MRSKILLSTALTVMLAMPAFAANVPQTTGAATDMAAAKGETVDERITNLHSQLQITPDEEKKWNKVAQAMRDNASNMEKMIQDKQSKAAQQNLSAKDDLKVYQQFAQAHVNGLKNLRSSFDSLYDSMTDDQKKNADDIFQKFGAPSAPAGQPAAQQ